MCAPPNVPSSNSLNFVINMVIRKMNTNHKLNVASNPHWKSGMSIARLQQLWVIALLPVISASVYRFGTSAIEIYCLCIASAVIADAGTNLIIKTRDPVTNWSSVPLAILLAVMLPVGTPGWLVVTGCLLMILLGKKLFGGIGAYPVHPVMLTYAMMHISWPQHFNNTKALLGHDWNIPMIDILQISKTYGQNGEALFSWQDLLMGYQVAAIGNGMILFILIGGLLLLLMRAISWHIPTAFILGVIGMSALLKGIDPTLSASPLFHLLSASTLLGAFFLATESTTSPVNPIPMLIYGFFGGALLVLLRSFSEHTDGIAFTILIINFIAPLVDRITPKIRGLEIQHHA